MKIIINENIDVLTNEDEKKIILNLDKTPCICYNEISSIELSNIKNKVQLSNVNVNDINDIIRSIRSNYMKNKIIKRHRLLDVNSKKIYKDYEINNDVLFLCKKYDLSPLNILRHIFNKKYNQKLKKIDQRILKEEDKIQLEIAKKNDIYSLLDNITIAQNATLYEIDIENYLKDNNIEYKTQEDLTKEQIKKYGHAINTPDFLITSELYINDFKINWIDAKNYYGSNNKFVRDSIKKQIKKYISEYGNGSIIFKLGFTLGNINDNVKLLSYRSLFTSKIKY